MSTSSGGVTAIPDVLTEGTDGQFIAVTLADPATDETIDTTAITAILATLRSLDTEEALFEDVSVFPGGESRGSYSVDDEIVVTFTATDMASKGTREMQRRLLTLEVTHSGGKVFNCAVEFGLRNLRDVG